MNKTRIAATSEEIVAPKEAGSSASLLSRSGPRLGQSPPIEPADWRQPQLQSPLSPGEVEEASSGERA